MEIKIESSPELLQELHEMLYAADPELEIDEQHGPSEGYQKEPLVSALILLASSPVVVKLISAFVKLRQTRIKAEVQKDKNKKNAEKDVMKFFIKEEYKWKQLQLKELKATEKTKSVKKKKD